MTAIHPICIIVVVLIIVVQNQLDKDENYKHPQGYIPGVKRLRGKAIMYEECKVNLNLTITPVAREYLRTAAQAQGISMSELIEQWARTTLNHDQV